MFIDKNCEGVITKSKVLEKISKNNNQERLKNTTWHWHNKNGKYKNVSERTSGLLFKMINNIWHIKYNL